MTLDLASFLRRQPEALSRGPLAILLIEDDVAVAQTLRHHLDLGFRHILALSPEPIDPPAEAEGRITNLIYDTRRRAAHVAAVNAVIDAVPEGTWLYYAFNAEFLFFPFCHSRSIGEMLAFHTEERRTAMISYVVDLYAGDLTQHPDAVDLEGAMFDRTGYYALSRKDREGRDLPQQMDFHGGLRWRFEEFLPADRLRIDRIALFRTRKGLRVTEDHRFNFEAYNTYACPWHHNLTSVIASFRVAKALVRNPGSRDSIRGFVWSNSEPFAWSDQQLMDLGLMEPGQWF